MKFYFAEDIISPFDGEVLYLVGEPITEDAIHNLQQYDIFSYEISLYPIEPGPTEQIEDESKLVTEYLGLE